ncbi:RAMP superfamily CRISPR-associated protein [Fusobacterium polymorphum]|jgi:hypothetical protein|uniref:CRISPR type III-associated protein domain-containing protein n=2 Tax=Fusobacterium TaxID=848 RepID=A0A241Q1G8_FUSNP|nr:MULTISPECIES: RAMP superfamily CRISPR-associated protein [Fusobacterium]ASG28449.1 hypothetical protein CBG61_05600 [Fusobacterium polymorphum]ETZ29911.1 hypothetical protein HMPREF2085_00309 [Fusobacterium nucleatum 13_3C]
MEEVKKIKEFLKLENRLILKLRIKPLSPLCIKLSCDDDSDSLNALLTTEGGKKIKSNNKGKEGNNKKATELYKREGEIYIPGSTLKGLFRDRFTLMYGKLGEKQKRFETDYIKTLFGDTEDKNNENKLAKKSKVFIQDSFLEEKSKNFFKENGEAKSYRELFYEDEKNNIFDGSLKEKLIKIRSITPVDHFSSKAKVPLQYEYTMETFSTELIINNAKLQDLQGIFFVIRDSWNKEIRIGNSKTRGFGLIKFEIEDLIYEQFKSKDDDFRALEDFFEEKHNEEEKLIKFTFSKRLYLKKDFKKLYDKDGASNKFIISLFKGGEN